MGGPSVIGQPIEGSAEWDAERPRCLGAHKLSTRSRGHSLNWGSAAHVPRGASCLLLPGNIQRVSLGKSSPMFQNTLQANLPRLSSQWFFHFRAYFFPNWKYFLYIGEMFSLGHLSERKMWETRAARLSCRLQVEELYAPFIKRILQVNLGKQNFFLGKELPLYYRKNDVSSLAN